MAITLNEDYPFPATSEQLIEMLDEAYPPRCLRIDEDVIDHHKYAAVRELIDNLKAALDDYREEAYNDTTNESG
jgi:hypothetical protein